MDYSDEVTVKYPGNEKFDRIVRWLVRRVVVTEWIAKASTRNLKSHASVLLEQKRQLTCYTCVLHPCSDGRHYWDCFMILVSFIQLFITPLECGLGAFPEVYPWIYWVSFQGTRFAFDVLCCLDIVVHFNTGYYDDDQKEVQLGRREIAEHYMKTNFVIDVLASFPTQWCWMIDRTTHESLCIKISRGVSMLKVLRIYILGVYVKRICYIYNVSFYVYQVVYISFLYLIVWHVMSCLILFSASLSMNDNDKAGLFHVAKEEHAPWFLYVFMMYRGALYATVSTGMSAEGDLEGKGLVRYMTTIAQFIYAKVFQIYVLSHAIELIRARNSSSKKYAGIANQVTEFMRHKQLPMKIQNRIVDYYEYHYHKEYFRESDILHTISNQLRRDILMQKCILFTTKVEFFRGLPMYLLEKIVSLLQLQTYMVNDLIIKANTLGNNMYFISSGTVAVYTGRGKEICHLTDGEFFGEIALLHKDSMRIASVVALETTEVFTLSRKDFMRTIHPYPDLLEKVQRLAAERIDYTTYVELKFER